MKEEAKKKLQYKRQ